MAFTSGCSMKLICTTVWLSCKQKSDYQDPCNSDALPSRHLKHKNVSPIKQNKNGVKIVYFEMIQKKIKYKHLHTYIKIYIYTGCPRRNVKYFGRVFLMLNYTDITQNTYIQS